MAVDILAIGAHMGDEVAWGLALAAHKRQGHTIGVLHLTPGEKGHPTMLPEDYARQKREESRACASALGAEWQALVYRDGELPVSDEVKWEIADIVRQLKPKTVITHWRGSVHRDHTAAADNLQEALFFAGLPAFKRAQDAHAVTSVYFGESCEDQQEYSPEVYVQVLPEDLEAWEKAMRSYALFRGEVTDFPYLDYYRSLARTRGCEGGWDYAATFALPPDARRRRVTTLL